MTSYKTNLRKVRSSRFEPGSEITKYFELLAHDSPIKAQYNAMIAEMDPARKKKSQENLRAQMQDGEHRRQHHDQARPPQLRPGQKELPAEFSDALAALRGYAQSKLNSAIVFSAGINRRLYTYIEKFKDFYADATGTIKKRIILKVSDYRSSFVQGCFLAKKGLWVSEYRIESGLNCGGHAFVFRRLPAGSDPGRIQEEKSELIATILKLCNEALESKRTSSPR